ncbi:hypothetical protein HH308_05355 [Gordonia sp. TBRC 11910]|uniref:PH (Pleckstrin Homology) domain-containing protein n=1 Tax=Gordonia asplenii TaxID=2725283 RepID=A0A848KWT5_9ACTN|nr:hypothetical protein [Gordonia asplenii]NMO00641.1 hypothetical protein [Gordonia asplenii]
MGLLAWLTRDAHTERDEFEDEEIVEFASARGTLTYRNYRDPRQAAHFQKMAAVWLVAMTRRRLVIRFGRRTFVDLDWTDPRVANLSVSVDDGGKFLVVYRAEKLRNDARGTVEIRVKTDDAERLVEAFEALRV